MAFVSQLSDAITTCTDFQKRGLWIYLNAHYKHGEYSIDNFTSWVAMWEGVFSSRSASIKQTRRLLREQCVFDPSIFRFLRSESKKLDFPKVLGYDASLNERMKQTDTKSQRKKHVLDSIERATGGGEFMKFEKL